MIRYESPSEKAFHTDGNCMQVARSPTTFYEPIDNARNKYLNQDIANCRCLQHANHTISVGAQKSSHFSPLSDDLTSQLLSTEESLCCTLGAKSQNPINNNNNHSNCIMQSSDLTRSSDLHRIEVNKKRKSCDDESSQVLNIEVRPKIEPKMKVVKLETFLFTAGEPVLMEDLMTDEVQITRTLNKFYRPALRQLNTPASSTNYPTSPLSIDTMSQWKQ